MDNSNTKNVDVLVSGSTVTWEGEGDEIAESTPVWAQRTLVAKKMAGLTKFTSELSEDAIINFADHVARDFGRDMALKEDDAAFNGDGTAAYGSIEGLCYLLRSAGALAGSKRAASGHDTYAELDVADLQSLIALLPAYARFGAKFYVSTQGHDLSFGRLCMAAGGNNIQNLQGGYGLSYAGYPVVPVQVMPGAVDQGTAGQDLSGEVMVLFGNLKQSSLFGSRRDITVKLADQRYFEEDKLAIRATARVDIDNWGVGDATTPGSVVALCGAA
jgi:HK97 family phage major capsid protein